MRRERLHITTLALLWYGTIPYGLADKAADVAAGLCACPFAVKFERLVAAAKSSLLIPGEPLEALRLFRERLESALINAGLDARPGRRFSPHITVAYRPTARFDVELPEAIIWPVRDFVLIDSFVGETRHVEVGRWPLVGTASSAATEPP